MPQVDDTKYTFLIADDEDDTLEVTSNWIKNNYPNGIVFTARDGREAQLKIQNSIPSIFITDLDMPKLSGVDLVQSLIKDKKYDGMQIIIFSGLPEQEAFVDEILSGRVAYLSKPCSKDNYLDVVRKCLNKGKVKEYRLKILKAGEVLFNEGDNCDAVYLVKAGQLRAFTQNNIRLGDIETGEFVGEMAHISGNKRSATVMAVSECELIEIASGNLDSILFSKPVWSKALMKNLSDRLRIANEKKK